MLLSIVFLLPIFASAAPPNLLRNPGFEEGDGGLSGRQPGIAKHWEGICGGPHPEIYALDSKVRHSGKASQRMSCEGFNYRWLTEGGYCYHIENGADVKHPAPTELGFQAIAQVTPKDAIKPGRNYRLSAWVKIQGLTDSWEWFRLGIYWLDSEGKFVSESREDHEKSKANYGTHDWKQISLVASAPANAAFAKVYLHHHFVHGIVWYDDISLAEWR